MYDRTTRAFAALFLLVSLAPPGCKEKAPAAPEAKSVTPEIQGCIPRCEGRQCGDDGCRGSCGECPADHRCNDRSECEPIPCTPDCTDKACGDDGCGGSCGACVGHRICDESFRCVIPPCEPDCVNKQCGGDGCGGICGICNPGTICREFRCIEEPCTPDCANRVCGDDGCGGTCGSCPPPNGCKEGRCERRIAVGFLVGDGTESWRKEAPSLGDFSRRLGNPPAVAHTMIGFPADWSGKCEYSDFPKAWFDNWLGVNPVGNAMITLLPQCGFPDFVEGFEPGSAAYEATRKLAETIAKVPGPVFLRFAHDMNTHWYPWATCYFDNRRKGCARTAADYQKGFANFARVIHQVSEG